ncbi:hypothetical protein DPMN_130122 [Dreissena polymorpha]|uniref:Uncharacterized protein n=1 Tax=Dreissena polymorpha TaxID=45954 RepID=A0A9D4JYW7_DREPO|nr:hypothetical protein DPMN_130122 [Dreissena polymorpha]
MSGVSDLMLFLMPEVRGQWFDAILSQKSGVSGLMPFSLPSQGFDAILYVRSQRSGV